MRSLRIRSIVFMLILLAVAVFGIYLAVPNTRFDFSVINATVYSENDKGWIVVHRTHCSLEISRNKRLGTILLSYFAPHGAVGMIVYDTNVWSLIHSDGDYQILSRKDGGSVIMTNDGFAHLRDQAVSMINLKTGEFVPVPSDKLYGAGMTVTRPGVAVQSFSFQQTPTDRIFPIDKNRSARLYGFHEYNKPYNLGGDYLLIDDYETGRNILEYDGRLRVTRYWW